MSQSNLEFLVDTDPAVAEIIGKEIQRQRSHLELIASENFTSPAVMAAQGSVLTNKYAEGLPSKRYYGGCHFVDQVEQLAIDRVKELFGGRDGKCTAPLWCASELCCLPRIIESG